MRPRRALLALLLFVLLLYVLPVQALIRRACVPLAFDLPTLGLGGLPPVLEIEVNVRYITVLLAAYLGLFALVALVLRLFRAYHWEEALDWLAKVTTVKDLAGMDRLLISVAALATVGFTVAIPRWHTEGIAVLAGLTWASMASNLVGQSGRIKPVPGPKPLRPLPQKISMDGDVQKLYAWRYPSRADAGSGLQSAFSVELSLSSDRYSEYQQKPREQDVKRWDAYVTAPIQEVEVLSGKVLALGRDRGYCSLEQACNTLAFTQQCIQYEHDRSPETGEQVEYPKYPIETLMEETGDCEDQSILTAAMLKRMGFDVALLLCPGHAAVGVAGAEGLPGTYLEDPATGVRYFYAETTAASWHLGELPDDMEQYLAKGQFEIVPVVARVG